MKTMNDQELTRFALNYWANHIETGDLTCGAEDCRNQDRPDMVRKLDDTQKIMVRRLRELANAAEVRYMTPLQSRSEPDLESQYEDLTTRFNGNREEIVSQILGYFALGIHQRKHPSQEAECITMNCHNPSFASYWCTDCLTGLLGRASGSYLRAVEMRDSVIATKNQADFLRLSAAQE